ncbi:arsenate reductase (glutaredoxin) [Phaeobacter piscinae]|uniref:Arsenate reductase n=1 Tax=Phaeobacter piscinae TaxID=1580596 RepID=A0AAN1GQ07_9RHOB|nr:arsenate reductase (glutaredoxin) [Phaeobacter piscinae]ATG43087.1 arsenate reductase (glutaredoxin) [Phaeobacter piscinae]AUQ74687.1 arsenate reductase (glutaredoxin) [Phaeobacter piscinae]AUR35405.1 arsenate reductase (glutaredoxin) [Phaeobacter piscinae]
MITYWHNPRCSKSRAGLALLEERGATVTVRFYLKDAPSEAELTAVQAKLGVRAIDMMRKGEKIFKELNLSTTDDDTRLIAAMAAHPILIERPIAITEETAIIGRPTEGLTALL